MKPRACRPPALGRDAAPTPAAIQQDLPLETTDRNRSPTRPAPVAVSTERLWFCAWLPKLPLEAVQEGATPAAVVEEQHGVHRILLADAAAAAAGVMPGQAANAARALLPVLQLEEEWHYLHVDHLATPRRVTDRDQVVVWSWDSTPFGRGLPDEDPDGDGRTFTLNLRFAGQYHDAESGLSYHHFRSYDPAIGRFLEADPVGFEGGINPFAYAESQPLALTDPLGLAPSGEWLRQPRFNISDYGITDVDAIAPYLDDWGFLKVFRVHGYASGHINLDVRCEDRDECSRTAWEVHEKIGLSYRGYKDLGPSLVAAGAGTAAGPLAGAATGIVTLGGSAMTALLDILREVEARGGDKLRWVWELGPTAICLASAP